MRAQQAGPRPLLLLLAVLLALLRGFGVQQASAQTFTNLTSVLILRQMPLNETEIKADMQGLQQKLWQIRNESSRSSGQLALLSPRSRAKLNTMTGTTLEFLQNRTDSQLAEILESIRAANYRRFMAINVVYSSLPRAFTSSNALGMLQALQIEDLERLASLPLAESKYQKLTNVTLLEMLNEIFNYGATQVKQRTCVLTAANTSTVAPLIRTSTTNFARHRRSLLKFQNVQEALQEDLQDMHRLLLEQGALREAVMTAAQEELQALPATFFRPHRRLQQQQDGAAAGTAEDAINATTVGSIVDGYLSRLALNQTGSGVVPNFTASGGPPYIQQTPETNPDGSVVGSNGQIYTPVNYTDVDLMADQLTARNEQELPPPEPIEDTEAGWNMPMDVYDPCENATDVNGTNCDDLYALEYGVERPRAADDVSVNTPSGGTVGVVNATQQETLVNCSSTRVNASIMLNVSCSNGTSFTRALDPCSLTPNRTVVDTAACAALGPCLPNNTYAVSGEPCDATVPPCTQQRIKATLTVTVTCRNGTTFNRTRDPCLLRPNGTIISEAACLSMGPCMPNGTYPSSGEPCNYTDAASRCIQGPAGSPILNGTRNVTCIPCVNGTTPEGWPCSVAPLNSSQVPCVNGTTPDGLPCNVTSNSSSPCVNGTTADGLPCNASFNSSSPCVNGTTADGFPCNSSSPAPCVNGTTVDGLPCNASFNSSSPCVNGTTADGLPCNSGSPAPCVNGTTVDGLPCNGTVSSLPCVNGTTADGLPCNSSSVEGALCVNGTSADGMPCNVTSTNSSSSLEPCVNGTMAEGMPCNSTSTSNNITVDPCVNGTTADGTPCNTSESSNDATLNDSSSPCVNGSKLVNGTEIPCTADELLPANSTGYPNTTTSGDATATPCVDGFLVQNGTQTNTPCNLTTTAGPDNTTATGNTTESGSNDTAPTPTPTLCYEDGVFVMCGSSPAPLDAALSGNATASPDNATAPGNATDASPAPLLEDPQGNTTTTPAGNSSDADVSLTPPLDTATNATDPTSTTTLSPPPAEDTTTTTTTTVDPVSGLPLPDATATSPNPEPSPATTTTKNPDDATPSPSPSDAVVITPAVGPDSRAPDLEGSAAAPSPSPATDNTSPLPAADATAPTSSLTPVLETKADPAPTVAPNPSPADTTTASSDTTTTTTPSTTPPDTTTTASPLPTPDPAEQPTPLPDTPVTPPTTEQPTADTPAPTTTSEASTAPTTAMTDPSAAAADTPADLEPVTPAPAPDPVPIPEPVTPAPEPAPVPKPATPAHEPVPVPEPVTPAPEPVPVPEPVTPAPEPVPVPEPLTPAPEPVPEPVTPAPEPAPVPEPVTPAPEPAPVPEPLTPAPEPVPVPVPEPVAPTPEPAPQPPPEPEAVAPVPEPAAAPVPEPTASPGAPEVAAALP